MCGEWGEDVLVGEDVEVGGVDAEKKGVGCLEKDGEEGAVVENVVEMGEAEENGGEE